MRIQDDEDDLSIRTGNMPQNRGWQQDPNEVEDSEDWSDDDDGGGDDDDDVGGNDDGELSFSTSVLMFDLGTIQA